MPDQVKLTEEIEAQFAKHKRNMPRVEKKKVNHAHRILGITMITLTIGASILSALIALGVFK